MPTLKSHLKRPEEKIRRGKLTQNLSLSFHGQSLVSLTAELHRPKTLPELLSNKDVVVDTNLQEGRPRLMKLLLNVTIQGSLGQLQVVMTPESTVNDLIATSVRIYAKEDRWPILVTTDPAMFDLHYSQFSLESLDREEKVIALGSRNYFLCVKKAMVDICTMTPSSSCSKQVEKASKNWFVWLKFMDFLQL
ncbi:uncharacterized protein LOC121238191 [Juglans microcarpa x Juglans regia]|uniref:uncharacterized protein LOC121238191 n=1 Tax=Juglans microcarpa x Juglans regia TaxID=2249226 RepID=UPI001B7E79D8|nr:uncharacterized protein LOC121238191 [Juglans microcarpa x Juglans regia]